MTYISVVSYVKGYHVYKNLWTPHLQEQVHGGIEHNNSMDKYAVAVKKDGKNSRASTIKENGKLTKTIFHLLWADQYGKYGDQIENSGKKTLKFI